MRHFRIFCIFFFSFLIQAVQAQSSAQRVHDSIDLQTVVIQSTRAGEKHPVPHTNLRAEKISAMYHAQDVPFLLSGVPSLAETSDGGTGTGYTGLRIRGSDPTRVNVTINGVPLNDAESQGVFWVNLPDLAASASEIQVQRGVGSSTNGAGSFGATVNLDVSKVSAHPFATLSATIGSFSTQKQSVYMGTGLLRNRVAFTGRMSRITSDGYTDRASADLRSFHLSGAYIDDRQSLMVHLLSGNEVTYQAWYGLPAQYLSEPALRTYNPAGTERSGTPYPDEVDNYTQRHTMLHYKRQLRPHFYLQVNGHYTRGFGYFEQYKAGQQSVQYGIPFWGIEKDSSPLRTDLVRRRWLSNHFYGGTFALRWSPQAPFHPVFLLGGGLNQYQGRHFGEMIWTERGVGVQKDHRYYDNDALKTDGNVFLKAEWNLSKALTAFGDLQYRHVGYQFLGYNNLLENVRQESNFSFFNPKAGFTWSPRPQTNVHFFVGTAAREPNRDDFTQSTPRSRPRAEYLYNVETGIKKSNKWWAASANFYGMYYKNQLVLDGRINDVGAYIRTNVPDSYRAGIELEMTLQAAPRWSFQANASFSRNKIPSFTEYRDNWATGAQETIVHRQTDLAFSPRSMGRAEAGYALLQQPRHSLKAYLSGKYVGRQFLDNTSNSNTALDPFFFSDLRLQYDLKEWIGQNLRLIASVNNLFNARYSSNGWAYRFASPGYDPRPDDPFVRREGGDLYHQAGFFPQAGRHGMLSAVVQW